MIFGVEAKSATRLLARFEPFLTVTSRECLNPSHESPNRQLNPAQLALANHPGRPLVEPAVMELCKCRGPDRARDSVSVGLTVRSAQAVEER